MYWELWYFSVPCPLLTGVSAIHTSRLWLSFTIIIHNTMLITCLLALAHC